MLLRVLPELGNQFSSRICSKEAMGVRRNMSRESSERSLTNFLASWCYLLYFNLVLVDYQNQDVWLLSEVEVQDLRILRMLVIIFLLGIWLFIFDWTYIIYLKFHHFLCLNQDIQDLRILRMLVIIFLLGIWLFIFD